MYSAKNFAVTKKTPADGHGLNARFIHNYVHYNDQLVRLELSTESTVVSTQQLIFHFQFLRLFKCATLCIRLSMLSGLIGVDVKPLAILETINGRIL
jgi:hypothetical protein